MAKKYTPITVDVDEDTSILIIPRGRGRIELVVCDAGSGEDIHVRIDSARAGELEEAIGEARLAE